MPLSFMQCTLLLLDSDLEICSANMTNYEEYGLQFAGGSKRKRKKQVINEIKKQVSREVLAILT